MTYRDSFLNTIAASNFIVCRQEKLFRKVLVIYKNSIFGLIPFEAVGLPPCIEGIRFPNPDLRRSRPRGGIDGANRDSGGPVRMEARRGKGLVDASLIGAERAAALQQEGDAFEGRTAARPIGLRPGASAIRGLNVVKHDEVHLFDGANWGAR